MPMDLLRVKVLSQQQPLHRLVQRNLLQLLVVIMVQGLRHARLAGYHPALHTEVLVVQQIMNIITRLVSEQSVANSND